MATKDTTLQSDISKTKTADAPFRNRIAKGSQFEPEIGGFQCFMLFVFAETLPCLPRPLSPLCFLCLSYVLRQPWDHEFVSIDMFIQLGPQELSSSGN